VYIEISYNPPLLLANDVAAITRFDRKRSMHEGLEKTRILRCVRCMATDAIHYGGVYIEMSLLESIPIGFMAFAAE